MKSKETKRKEALDRAEATLGKYINGDWTPSSKDIERGTTLYEKISRITHQISRLTQ